MSKPQAQHLVTGLVFAALAALAAAFAVVFTPSTGGEVLVGSGLGGYAAWWLGKHRHARRGAEALLLGGLLAAAAIIFVRTAVPGMVFALLAARPAAHYLDPRRVRVVRTTRGVRKPAARAGGGRPGRPAEKAHAPRKARAASSRPVTPRTPARKPVKAEPAHTVTIAPPARAWPELEPWREADALPWAGEAAPAIAPKLAADKNRPTKVHRQVCSGCAAGECAEGVCKSRGCECAAPAHDVPPY